GAASEALLGVSNERTGVVSVSLASGNPIPTGGLVLMIEFTGIGSDDSPFVRLSSAEIDEQQTRVITHSANWAAALRAPSRWNGPRRDPCSPAWCPSRPAAAQNQSATAFVGGKAPLWH